MNIDLIEDSDNQLENIFALKEAVAKGYLGYGEVKIIAGKDKMYFGRVLSFPVQAIGLEQTSVVIITNEDSITDTYKGYIHLEVTDIPLQINRSDRLDLLYAAIKAEPDWAPGLLKLAQEEGYLDYILDWSKGKFLYSSSSSHHSGESALIVVSVGEGLAVYEWREMENIGGDDEDARYNTYCTSDGLLYPIDIDLSVSVKRGSHIEGSPLRPLNDEEKSLLLKYQPEIVFL